MTIAMDATSLGDRFVVLAISVVYRGCAVPVAWKVLKAEEVVGSGNTRTWMTRRGQSDCGWRLLSPRGGCCLSVAKQKLKPTRR